MTSVTPLPAAQQLGTAVLVQGPAVLDLWYLAALGVRVCKRDGLMPAGRLEPLLAVLAAAATAVKASGAGHSDVAAEPDSAESGVLDEVSTAEVARMLELSHRQAQRLMHRLGAHLVTGGALVVDRGAVEAHLLERQAATTSEKGTR